MNKKLYLFLVLLVFTGLIVFYLISSHVCTEKRYSFDIGSGSIKAKAALVNHCKGVLVENLGNYVVHNKFVNCLINSNGTNNISVDCFNKGLAAVDDIEHHYGIKCSEEKCAGVATAWARQATNSDNIIQGFRDKHINVEIVSQEQEGEIAFKSARAHKDVKRVSEKNIIVWDIGAGSFQLTTLDDEGKLHVYHGATGIETYEQVIRSKYKIHQSDELPYLTDAQLKEALETASKDVGNLVLNDPVIAKKLMDPKVKVFTMGRPMYWGLKIDLELPANLNKEKLVDTALKFSGKTADEMKTLYHNLPDHFIYSAQASLVVIYGIMNGAGIKEINILDSTMNDYVLTEPKFWQNK